jgi:hypothetical protein
LLIGPATLFEGTELTLLTIGSAPKYLKSFDFFAPPPTDLILLMKIKLVTSAVTLRPDSGTTLALGRCCHNKRPSGERAAGETGGQARSGRHIVRLSRLILFISN